MEKQRVEAMLASEPDTAKDVANAEEALKQALNAE